MDVTVLSLNCVVRTWDDHSVMFFCIDVLKNEHCGQKICQQLHLVIAKSSSCLRPL